MKRIQLLKVVHSQSAGGVNQSTQTRYTYWAEVVRGSASRSGGEQSQLHNSYTFRIRKNSSLDVNAKWAVIYNGKQFTVTGIRREDEQDFWWIIEAEARHG